MDDNKKIYTIDEVSKLLSLGKSKTYEFIQKVYEEKKPFKVIKIGRVYKIFKDSFDCWISQIES